MTPARRFAFGHEPAQARAATEEAAPVERSTIPMVAAARPTMPLAADATPPAAALPFRAPASTMVVRREATAPLPSSRVRRRGAVGIWIAIGVAALALYTAAIWLILTPIPGVRHAPGERVTASSAQASEPDPDLSAAPSAAPSTTPSASAIAPVPTVQVTARPSHVPRPPAPPRPRRTLPFSDVHDPWGYE